MPRGFKYDVIKLIHGVRDRPCLWDKTLENYKDRMERRSAWEEIFVILDGRYLEMAAEEKRIMGEHVLNKWTNIRDTFVKTLKTKMGKPKKKYLLYEHLKFLTKIIPEEESNLEFNVTIEDNSLSEVKQEENGDHDRDNTSTYEEPKKTYQTRKRKKVDYNEEYISAKKTEELEAANDVDYVELEDSNDPRIMNEDEAFFASLLPSVVRYNEDEKLEFRIEVLAVMKKIKDKRKWNCEDFDKYHVPHDVVQQISHVSQHLDIHVKFVIQRIDIL